MGLVFVDIEKDYIRVSGDAYLDKKYFDLSIDEILAIKESLMRYMNLGYLSLIGFDKWEELPQIKYEWNAYLLRSVVDNYIDELKVVEPENKDRRYERGVIVMADSEMNDLVDIAISLMKKTGYEELPENKMLSLLVLNNVVYKIIPKEFYSSEKISYTNDVFRIMKG